MTDGHGYYNTLSMSQFTNHPDLSSKLEFTAVGFGNANNQTLQTIAGMMPNGQCSQALSAEELKSSMLKIVPNLYQE